MNCYEIESTVVFYVAAFSGLGISPNQCAEQHVALRSNGPEQPSRDKLADFHAWNSSAERGAANAKHNATDARNFSGNSGRIGTTHSRNCSGTECRAEHNRSQRDNTGRKR